MTDTATRVNTSWCENLVTPGAFGHRVHAAQLIDELAVAQLLLEMMRASEWQGSELGIESIREWAQRVLSSHLWLVLLLRDRSDHPCGLAIGQYISYDVDGEQRILKCKQLYVRQNANRSCLPLANLLLRALLTAARRSPKVRDVFLVTLGATRLSETARLLERGGFRRVGTQHIGLPKRERSFSGLKELRNAEEMTRETLASLQELGEAFLQESSRAAVCSTINFNRLIEHALGHRHHAPPVAFLSFDGRKVVGFITGRPEPIALSQRSYLQSSFFYVDPAYRGTPRGAQLFDAFALKARELGLDGANFGTSSEIDVDRVCRFLHLRGYRHYGDVFARRVDRHNARC